MTAAPASPTGPAPQVVVAENISHVRQVLSVLDPDRPLWVIATDSAVNHAFYGDFLKPDRFIAVPGAMCWGCLADEAPPAGWRRIVDVVGANRDALDQVVAALPPGSELLYWHFMGCMPLLSILIQATAAGHAVVELDSDILSGLFQFQRRGPEDLAGTAHPTYVSLLLHAGQVLGGPIKYVEARPRGGDDWRYGALGIDGADLGERRWVALDDWATLARRYGPLVEGLLPDRAAARRALLLDDTVLADPRVDLDASRAGLAAAVREMLDEGWEVHLKPHPNAATDILMLPPEEAGQLTVLPGWLPAELLMGHYDRVGYLTSTASMADGPDERLCLLPRVRYRDEAGETFCWSLFRLAFLRGGQAVTLIAPDPAETRRAP
ncbi:hypothetical protein [Roseospira visakhapatnamensis]|uniref:Uncharacterized protein n=1 Tax=Roseospira visakhapatnamensis TaxID=390880 RepID=A0A7W6WA78_9PROT|nr:hypothetical protein [Roseospira visakhapatnamensis]MBB4266196.1 hypothetical protein [Roseospira visakhapatnamensis]